MRRTVMLRKRSPDASVERIHNPDRLHVLGFPTSLRCFNDAWYFRAAHAFPAVHASAASADSCCMMICMNCLHTWGIFPKG